MYLPRYHLLFNEPSLHNSSRVLKKAGNQHHKPHIIFNMSNPIDDRLLALTAIVTIAFQFTFFVITYALRFDKVTDFAGSTNFILLAILTLTLGSGYNPRQIVITSCVLVWGVRLCAFLLYRIILWGEDRRFDDKRNNLPRLAAFWILQAVWAWTVSLPTTIINSKTSSKGLNALDYVGWAIFAFGFVLEATADQQKLFFKRSPESKGRWTDVGVWSWSRHPNFFGEMLVWWGLYLSAINDLEGGEHAAVVSPIFITLLLMFISGIPLLEKSADGKHGGKEEYVTYKKRTSVLILFPPGLYEKLPETVKKTLLLDFALYNPGPAAEEDAELGNGAATETTELVSPTREAAR